MKKQNKKGKKKKSRISRKKKKRKKKNRIRSRKRRKGRRRRRRRRRRRKVCIRNNTNHQLVTATSVNLQFASTVQSRVSPSFSQHKPTASLTAVPLQV
jgi:hypothetical protein